MQSLLYNVQVNNPMRKKKALAFLSISLCLSVIGVAAIEESGSKLLFGDGLPATSYSMSLGEDTVNGGETEKIFYTQNGNPIQFALSGVLHGNSFLTLENGGHIANISPINGLKYIRIRYESNEGEKLHLSYGWGDCEYSQTTIQSNEIFSFNNENPCSFKIDNFTSSTVNISSIDIGYSCVASSPKNSPAQYVCEKEGYKYVIKLNELSVSAIENAYKHAISIGNGELTNFNEIEIRIPAGDLYISRTFDFSGVKSSNLPLNFVGNNTTIHGGYALTKGEWSLYQNGIYRMNIGEGLDKFSNLIVNGVSATLARSDDVDFSYDYSSKKINVSKSALNLSSIEGTFEIVTLEKWGQNIAPIDGVTPVYGGLFNTTLKSFDLILNDISNYVYFEINQSYRPTSTTSLNGYLQDNLFFLDSSNEWFYDSATGFLYFKPDSSTSINEATFIIPTVETIIDTANMSSGISFKGLTFDGTSYASPLIEGFSEAQTSLYINGTSKNSTLITPMIRIQSSDVSFTDCVFKNTSNIGVHIDQGCDKVNIENNSFECVGAGGIYIGHPSSTRKGSVPSNILVANNKIDGFGKIYKGGPGITAMYIDKLDIIHNEILNGGYSGIAAGWGWTTDQSSYGHSRYTISYNRISNIMDSAFHDGGCIYVLGNFPTTIDNIYNSIDHNYVEINNLCNGGIYLDEGSSSWHVHDNVINVTSTGSTQHGVIMMHDPKNTSVTPNISQFGNHIENNYYRGQVYGSEGVSQLSYVPGSGIYTGSELESYNNERNIIFETPIEGNDTHVKESIYSASGNKDLLEEPFKNEAGFAELFSSYSALSLDSTNKKASFNVGTGGITLSSNYLQKLISLGCKVLQFNIEAESLGGVEACYAVYYTSGATEWSHFFQQSEISSGRVGKVMLPLDKFSTKGTTCTIQIRDKMGLSADNNLDAHVTISNFKLGKIKPLYLGSTMGSIVDSSLRSSTFSFKDVSYNWQRIKYDNIGEDFASGVSKIKISIKGNKHNIYVFKCSGDECDYDHMIRAGGGITTIDLDNSDKSIAIMTTHENYDGTQDDAGLNGTTENLEISLQTLNGGIECIEASEMIFSRYIGALQVNDFFSDGVNVTFINSRMRLLPLFLNEVRSKNIKSFEFDIVIPSSSLTTTIVTCWFNGPNGENVEYSNVGVFAKNNGVIHIRFESSSYQNTYIIELVSRPDSGYGGDDVTLEGATIKNFKFNY